MARRQVVPAEAGAEGFGIDDAVAVPVVHPRRVPVPRTDAEARDALRTACRHAQRRPFHAEGKGQGGPLAAVLQLVDKLHAPLYGFLPNSLERERRRPPSGRQILDIDHEPAKARHALGHGEGDQPVEQPVQARLNHGGALCRRGGRAEQEGRLAVRLLPPGHHVPRQRLRRANRLGARHLQLADGQPFARHHSRLRPVRRVARCVPVWSRVTFQPHQHRLPRVRAQVRRSVQPPLRSRELLVQHLRVLALPVLARPYAKQHAIARWFLLGAVADGDGKHQLDWPLVRQLQEVVTEDRSPARLPRRMHVDRGPRIAARQ